MNRRQALRATLTAATAAAVFRTGRLGAQGPGTRSPGAAGDEVTNPNHVAIIANGNGVNVHHCVFRGLKISVVFWTPGSSGHAMTHCLCSDLYGSAIWPG